MGGPKRKPTQNCQLIVLNRTKAYRSDYIFVKLKRQPSAILSVGIKYSMRDLMCDVNYRACNAKLR